MIKPLCLSFRTPPAVRPQSILIGKMIPEWINQGLKPVVINYDSNGDWDIDLPLYSLAQFRVNRYVNKLLPIKHFLEDRYYKKIFQPP